MSRRITLTTFRKVHEAEERMLRAVMPRTSERNPEPLPHVTASGRAVVVVTANGARLVRRVQPLTYTLTEAACA